MPHNKRPGRLTSRLIDDLKQYLDQLFWIYDRKERPMPVPATCPRLPSRRTFLNKSLFVTSLCQSASVLCSPLYTGVPYHCRILACHQDCSLCLKVPRIRISSICYQVLAKHYRHPQQRHLKRVDHQLSRNAYCGLRKPAVLQAAAQLPND